MADFERLPYEYPSEDEIKKCALGFIEYANEPSYTIGEAEIDAFVFLNMRNAVNSKFIDSVEHVGPNSRIRFTIEQD